MHEMAIAEGVLDIALDYANRNKAKKIGRVALLIGEMSGAEPEALRFAWDRLTEGTFAEGSELTIKRTPLVGQCHLCGEKFPLDHYDFRCPKCADGVLKIISGREMQVEYLEVE